MKNGWLGSHVPVVSVSLPDDLLVDADAAIQRDGLKGRSELVRTALRAYLAAQQPPGHHAHGSLTLVYPHGNEDRISNVTHGFHDVVQSLMHTHCEPEVCMDVLIVGGDGERVQDLQRRLARLPAMIQATLVLAR